MRTLTHTWSTTAGESHSPPLLCNGAKKVKKSLLFPYYLILLELMLAFVRSVGVTVLAGLMYFL